MKAITSFLIISETISTRLLNNWAHPPRPHNLKPRSHDPGLRFISHLGERRWSKDKLDQGCIFYIEAPPLGGGETTPDFEIGEKQLGKIHALRTRPAILGENSLNIP